MDMRPEGKVFVFTSFPFFVVPDESTIPISLESKYSKFWFSNSENHKRILKFFRELLNEEKIMMKEKLEGDEPFEFIEVKRLFVDCRKKFDEESKKFKVECRERAWVDENGKGWKLTLPRTLTTKAVELLDKKFSMDFIFNIKGTRLARSRSELLWELLYRSPTDSLFVALLGHGLLEMREVEGISKYGKYPVVVIDEEKISEKVDELFDDWLRYYQKNAVTRIIPYLAINGGALLRAVTGAGKTEIAVALVKFFELARKANFVEELKKLEIEHINDIGSNLEEVIDYHLRRRRFVMVLTYQRELAKQFVERARKYGIEAYFLDIQKKDELISTIHEVRNSDSTNVVIFAMTVQSLAKVILDDREKRVLIREGELDGENGIDEKVKFLIKRLIEGTFMIIVDEAHHVPARLTSMIMEKIGAEKLKLGLTATPWREDGRTFQIMEKIGDLVNINIDINELSDTGYIIKPEVRQIEIEYPSSAITKIEMQENGAKRYAKEREIATLSEAKVAVILDELERLKDEGLLPALILTPLVQSAKTISTVVEKKLGLRSDWLVGNDSDEKRNEVLEKVKNGELDVVVATTLADEGLDIPNLRSVVLVYPGKSSTKLLQRIGRAMRKATGKNKAVVIDFVDGLVYAQGHAARRRAIFRNEGLEVKEMRSKAAIESWLRWFGPDHGIEGDDEGNESIELLSLRLLRSLNTERKAF